MFRWLFTLGMILLSFPIFSQELSSKNITQLIQEKKYQQAVQLLKKVRDSMSNVENQNKIYINYLAANSALNAIENGEESDELYQLGIIATDELKSLEKKEKSSKYSTKLNKKINKQVSNWVSEAIQYNKSENYPSASKKFDLAYQLSPTDTIYLYYSAGADLFSKDYDNAERKLRKLVDLNYDGKNNVYTAVNVQTKQVESFGQDKKIRDSKVRSGRYENPQTLIEPSKKGDIYKNLGFILMLSDNYSDGEKILEKAYKENPEDEDVLIALLDLYQKTNREYLFQRYAKIAQEKGYEWDMLDYNIGVNAYNRKEFEKAKKYFNQAIQKSSNASMAYFMLANIELMQDAEITSKLNVINEKIKPNEYKKLIAQKVDIYKKALEYLEKSQSVSKGNENINQLISEIKNYLDNIK